MLLKNAPERAASMTTFSLKLSRMCEATGETKQHEDVWRGSRWTDGRLTSENSESGSTCQLKAPQGGPPSAELVQLVQEVGRVPPSLA